MLKIRKLVQKVENWCRKVFFLSEKSKGDHISERKLVHNVFLLPEKNAPQSRSVKKIDILEIIKCIKQLQSSHDFLS